MNQRQHLMYVYINDDMDDSEPFIFEADTNVNPMDADYPETAYREYLAERFSR
jgi:hypothetical protein